MQKYRHIVQYYETDKMGITHHSNYIRWMEEARIDFLRQIGWDYAKLESIGIITTSRRIVNLLKEAGATEVHVAIGSPALAYPCFYGIDIQTRKELIAANHTVEETREIIGADSLTYLSIDGLIDSIGIDTDAPNGGLCVAYFDGKYPTPLYDYEERYLESLKEHTSFY